MNFLQRLFSQPKVSPAPEVPAGNEVEVESEQSAARPGRIGCLPPGLHVGRISDVGRVRERNEDSLFSVQSLVQDDNGQAPFGLFIVADGMGGHQKGEVASGMAVRKAAGELLRDVYLSYLDSDSRSAANRPINEALAGAVESANTAIQKEITDGGTTITIALVMGQSAYIAHVGDSRAYLIQQDGLKQITKDHSYVQRLIELGQETPEGALTHPQRNVLYRALGQGSVSEVDTYVQHLPPGSSLLLCSDGLWGAMDEETLKRTVTTADAPQEACERLVDTANRNGGEDNITAIIISMGVEVQGMEVASDADR